MRREIERDWQDRSNESFQFILPLILARQRLRAKIAFISASCADLAAFILYAQIPLWPHHATARITMLIQIINSGKLSPSSVFIRTESRDASIVEDRDVSSIKIPDTATKAEGKIFTYPESPGARPIRAHPPRFVTLVAGVQVTKVPYQLVAQPRIVSPAQHHRLLWFGSPKGTCPPPLILIQLL